MAPCKNTSDGTITSKVRKPTKPVKLARQAKPVIRKRSSTPLKGRNAVFSGKVFVFSGEFPNAHAVMEGWITHHGGRVDKVVTDETTHLVCTTDNFKNKVADVKNARRLGKTKCKIIDWEFLEDSILPKPRRLSDACYRLENMLLGEKRKIAPIVRKKKNNGKNPGDIVKGIEPACHHLYIDKTGFKYKIVLQRSLTSQKDRELEEFLTIYIFESNATPPSTYLLVQEHKIGGKPAVLHHDKSVGRVFREAFDEFETIFEEKTGRKWDQRLDNIEQDSGKFVYVLPSRG